MFDGLEWGSISIWTTQLLYLSCFIKAEKKWTESLCLPKHFYREGEFFLHLSLLERVLTLPTLNVRLTLSEFSWGSILTEGKFQQQKIARQKLK